MLAVLVASAIDLAHEDTSPADVRKQAVADCLARQLDIDMTRFWTPGLDYWIRLPKSTLMAALPEAPAMASKSERTRAETIKAHAKLRKDDLAAKVSALFEGAGICPIFS